MASFAEFLQRLLTEGQVHLDGRPALVEGEEDRARGLLEEAYAGYRLELAGPLVPFEGQVALAAAQVLGNACWLLLSRTERPEEASQLLRMPGRPQTPAEHLSADLTFRFLPAVYRRSVALAPQDVLTRELARILREWPLSGVLGDEDEGPDTPLTFLHHPGLLLLYAERLASHSRAGWVPAEGEARDWAERVFAERQAGLPGS